LPIEAILPSNSNAIEASRSPFRRPRLQNNPGKEQLQIWERVTILASVGFARAVVIDAYCYEGFFGMCNKESDVAGSQKSSAKINAKFRRTTTRKRFRWLSLNARLGHPVSKKQKLGVSTRIIHDAWASTWRKLVSLGIL
jgi:hypothetical protein